MTTKSNSPLGIRVEDGLLTINIGIETLAFCFEMSEYNNPFFDKKQDWVKCWKVTDPVEFAKDVVGALYDEREDGSTILTDLLDKACEDAVEQGCIGIDQA